MDRSQLEAAITALHTLLGDEDASEERCQDWFEQHPVVFEVLGCAEWLVKPPLCEGGRPLYVPDFMIQRVGGLWEVFEIKTPATAVLRHSQRRRTFYSIFNTYLAQCHEYSAYFDDSSHRVEFETQHGRAVQSRPESILVAGRARGLDRAKIHEMLAVTVPRVQLVTYDDVLTSLEQHRTRLYGAWEGIDGIAIQMVLIPRPVASGLNFVLDVGLEQSRNRVSLYFDERGDLIFHVRDANSREMKARVRRSAGALAYNRLVYVAMELALGAAQSLQTIEVGGVYRAEVKEDPLRLDLPEPLPYVMGSDLTGTRESAMEMVEIVVRRLTLSFADKMNMRWYVYNKYRTFWDNPAALPTRLVFSGHQIRYSHGHPLHDRGGDAATKGDPEAAS